MFGISGACNVVALPGRAGRGLGRGRGDDGAPAPDVESSSASSSPSNASDESVDEQDSSGPDV